MWRGCVTLLVACVLAIAGGYLGMILFGGVGFLDLLQGDAALATGLVAGFIGGLVLAGWVLPLVPKTAKYEPFARRLANAFTTAAFCWFVPGLLCAMAMRDLVLGVGRFGFRDWAFFLPAVAVIIPLGAALTAAVFANKCKKRILASFDAWCKGTNS
jgi:hypothetical protein